MLEQRYELDPDPGIHACCEWFLKRMDRISVIDRINAQLKEQHIQRAGWMLDSNGHTMAIIRGPIDFIAGTHLKDPDRSAGTSVDPVDGSLETWSEDHPHSKHIPRSFAVAPGQLKPNEFGLFDTLGNVAEWCLDEFDLKTPESRLKELDVEGPLDSQLDRILRGSSIYSMSEYIRASDYTNFKPTYREGNTGFRIAKTIP